MTSTTKVAKCNSIFTTIINTELNKSAITDHVARENHIIDWEKSNILDKEETRKTRWIKESIWIRSRNSTMNRDGGTY